MTAENCQFFTKKGKRDDKQESFTEEKGWGFF